MAVPFPLAAGFDWLEGILPLLFLLFWIVSQIRALFGGGRAAKRAGPVVVRPGPRPPDDEDEARRELARQIEEFVRRASGEEKRPRRESATRPLETPAGQRRPTSRPRPPALPKPRTSPPTPVRAERALGSLGGHATDVARHVASAFAQEIPHLAAGGAAAAAVAGAPTVAVRTAPLTAPGIAELVRDPATLRQLVLVREVLERPVHRW